MLQSKSKCKRCISGCPNDTAISDNNNHSITYLLPNVENTVAFVNTKSGVQNGPKIITELTEVLGEANVFDLSVGGPKPGLIQSAHKSPDFRVIVCGGDGTVSWVLNGIDELDLQAKAKIAILPIGTGNDLGRVLRWGHKLTNDFNMKNFIRQVVTGRDVSLDRWSISTKIQQNEKSLLIANSKTGGWDPNQLPVKGFNNYFSFGADAKIALDFHISREKNPDKFTKIAYNKLVYAKHFTKDVLLYNSSKNMVQSIKAFEIDGQNYLDKLRKMKYHSVVCVNIPSYANGRNPWKKDQPGYSAQSFSDSKFEVVGFKTIGLMWLQVGLAYGDTIAQASKIRIVTADPLPFQVDGEASMLNPAEITLQLKNKANMILGHN